MDIIGIKNTEEFIMDSVTDKGIEKIMCYIKEVMRIEKK